MKLITYLCALGLLATSYGCKKDYNEINAPGNGQMATQSTTDIEPWISARKYSPYATTTVRALRTALAGDSRQIIQDNFLMPLNPNNYQLYYKININSESDATAFNNWLDSDTNNLAVRYPIDSVAMFPHLFTRAVLDSLEENNTVFYTTVPRSAALPSTMNATLLDTPLCTR